MTATTVRQLLDAALHSMRVCMGVVREWGVASEDYVGVVPIEGQVNGRDKRLETTRRYRINKQRELIAFDQSTSTRT